MTNKEYIENSVELHDEYFTQFNKKTELKSSVQECSFRVKNVDINSPLEVWDKLPDIQSDIVDEYIKGGDYYTLGFKVCYYKALKRSL